jgi:hypothetical protein
MPNNAYFKKEKCFFFGAALAKREKNGAKFKKTPFIKKVLEFLLQSKTA